MGHEEEPYGDGSRSAAETAGLSEKSRRRLENAKAANTIKAYDSDWRDFAALQGVVSIISWLLRARKQASGRRLLS